jgi:hypothetical protein
MSAKVPIEYFSYKAKEKVILVAMVVALNKQLPFLLVAKACGY